MVAVGAGIRAGHGLQRRIVGIARELPRHQVVLAVLGQSRAGTVTGDIKKNDRRRVQQDAQEDFLRMPIDEGYRPVRRLSEGFKERMPIGRRDVYFGHEKSDRPSYRPERAFGSTQEETHMEPGNGCLENDLPLQTGRGFQVPCGSLPGGALLCHNLLPLGHEVLICGSYCQGQNHRHNSASLM